MISRLRVDTQNRLWVGTDRDGLYCINTATGKTLQHYTAKGEKRKKLHYQGVADVLQYNDSIFYISGNGLSILNANTNTFQYFTVADGMPSANITNLLKDKNGYIWMTTGAGIVCSHPQKRKLSHYDASDGVHNYSFNVGASALLKNGNIVFGTNHDFLMFSPDDLTARKYLPPKVHISSMDIMGIPYNVDSLYKLSVIELHPAQNAFKAFFTTLTYKDVHAVYYMLDGFDKNWRKSDKTNVVEYSYLPPGKYILKATCRQEDGSFGEITALTMHVSPPFYKTWWFYSLIALTIGGLLFWLDRERTKRKEALLQVRSNIADNLHQEVNTALNNINILSEMALMKSANEPEKATEFVQQIQSKSSSMITAMDDMLWAIAPENDSMEKTIERMQEYIDALNNWNSSNIQMLADEKVKRLNLDMQFRHEAFILFKESIKALVDAGAGNCKIFIALDKTNLLYTVQFNNDSCDVQKLNNLLHRQDMGKRLDVIKAKLNVEVHKSTSLLELTIPV
jgi:hypothetical protein